jgi:hypothetical protein
MDLILLTTSDSSINANLIKSKLESEGVECYLHNENFSNMMPHFHNLLGSGIRIMVLDEDLQKAKRILNLNENQLRCPNCNSLDITNISTKTWKRVWLILMSFLMALPFGNIVNDYYCNNCGEEFKK